MQPGDHIGFNMAFLDSGGPGRVYLTDAPGTSKLSSAEAACVVAAAQAIHRTRHAYLGDSAPTFSLDMAAAAIQKAESDRAMLGVIDAKPGHVAPDAAYLAAQAHRRETMRNAYRN
jgi:hypothetical protein